MEKTAKSLFFLSLLFGGVNFKLVGANLTVERLVFALLFLPLVYLIAKWASWGAADRYRGGWLMGLWFAVLVFSTAMTQSPADHLNGLIICFIPSCLYFLFAGGNQSTPVIRSLIEPMLWYLGVGAVVVFVVNATFHPIWLDWAIDPSNRIMLTMVEPNIFGSLTGFFLILHFPQYDRSLRHKVLYAFAVAAIVLGLSRMPYLGFCVGTVVYLAMTGYLKQVWKNSLLFRLAPFALAILMLTTSLADSYDSSGLNRPDSFITRALVSEIAYERLFLLNPIFGLGALDLGVSSPEVRLLLGDETGRGVWIGNIFLSVAHDSGLVGLVVYTAFLAGLMVYGYRLARHDPTKQHLAYFCGMVTLLINNQTTTVHLSPVFGVAAGLLGSALFAGGNTREPVEPVEKAPV